MQAASASELGCCTPVESTAAAAFSPQAVHSLNQHLSQSASRMSTFRQEAGNVPERESEMFLNVQACLQSFRLPFFNAFILCCAMS